MAQAKLLLRDDALSDEAVLDFVESQCAMANEEAASSSGARSRQQTRCGNVGTLRLFLKDYRRARSGWERFRPLRLTRAWRSYRAGTRLRALGVSTPAPRFLVESNGSLILGCDQIEAEQLYHVIRDENWTSEKREIVVRGVTNILDKLKQARVTHGDLHPRNLLLDVSGKLWLVDLDGMRFHGSKASFEKRRRREEARLAKQLEIRPELLSRLGLEGARTD